MSRESREKKEVVPPKVERLLARVRGEGIDPAHIRSVKDNPLLGRAKPPVKSTVLIRDGSQVQEEELLPMIGKRIVRIVTERYDVTFYLSDGTTVKIADGGTGLAYLVVAAEKSNHKDGNG